MRVLPQHFMQASAQYLADVGNEQGAQRAAEMHGAFAADGQQAQFALVLERYHGGGADVGGMFLEQGLHFFFAHGAAHRLAVA